MSESHEPQSAISKAAAIMGRKGGVARARKLTPQRRSEIARIAHRASIGRNPRAKLPENPKKAGK